MRNLLFLAPLAAALNTERAQHGPLISLAVEAGQGCHPSKGPVGWSGGWCEVGFCDPSLAPTCASGLCSPSPPPALLADLADIMGLSG